LLDVNRFIPKSATRLTAGLSSTAMRRFLCISFSQIRAIAFLGWKERSLVISISKKNYLLNSTSARSPFWLRMFLEGSAIARPIYQMPNLRSPFWNKSKSAIAFWL
jgi:hypothetical protein